MAERPVFIPTTEGRALVQTRTVPFQWFAGLSVAQKQRSVDSLHAAAAKLLGLEPILEVSSKSREDLGVALSAFNLTFRPPGGSPPLCVECAFQASKVFAGGGPYTDIFRMSARDAKRDERLRSSGSLIGFRFSGVDWGLEPKTAFYDWLYLNALAERPELAAQLLRYSAFTDIEFNPERSVNCQAHSVALFVSLHRRDKLESALTSRSAFLEMLRQ